jgi:glycosyltransferase involved in cell wall biosynthesis
MGLRICLLCYRGNPYCGGQGIYSKYIAEELQRQGHDVHVIIGPPYPVFAKGITIHKIHNNEYFIKKGDSVINKHDPFDIFKLINFYEFTSSRAGVFPEIRSFSIRAYLKLRKLLNKFEFDIIHDNQCLGYGLLLMKSTGIPVVATIHHPLSIDLQTVIPKASTFQDAFKIVMFYPILMQKIVSKRLDHIIAVSENSKKNNNLFFSIPMEKQTVVYNGIDTKIFKPMKGIIKKKGKILFVGNTLDDKKGFPYLAKAVKNFNKNLNVTVVDINSKSIQKMINKLGAGNKIHFTGKLTLDELVHHYNEAEIVVVPSVYEGFGFPAAEAMACGTPVIASDGGALPEVVGNAGIVIQARNSDMLAESVNSLASDSRARKKMCEYGFERVKQLFTWEKAVSKMTDVFSRSIHRLNKS